jgi:hypothetical protein
VTTGPPADAASLTLGPSAPWVRRNVGPVAWSVLEALTEHAESRGTSTVSYRSVRDIAGELELAKDTVAGALRRLADHRLIAYVAGRSRDGRFAPSHYRLTLPSDLFLGLSNPVAPTPTRPKPNRPAHRPRPAQLSLIDDVPPDR